MYILHIYYTYTKKRHRCRRQRLEIIRKKYWELAKKCQGSFSIRMTWIQGHSWGRDRSKGQGRVGCWCWGWACHIYALWILVWTTGKIPLKAKAWSRLRAKSKIAWKPGQSMGKNGSNAELKRGGRGGGDCAVMSIAGTATIRCKGCWRTTGRARFQADSGSSQSRSWSRRKINLLEFFLFAKEAEEEEEAELGDTHTHPYKRENSLNVTNRHRDREGAPCPPTLQLRASGATAAAAVEVMRKQGSRRGEGVVGRRGMAGSLYRCLWRFLRLLATFRWVAGLLCWGSRKGKGNRCWCVWHVVRAAICLTCDVWQTEFTQVPLPRDTVSSRAAEVLALHTQQMPSKWSMISAAAKRGRKGAGREGSGHSVEHLNIAGNKLRR